MARKKNYTYNDWHAAKVNLIYSPYAFEKGDKPIFVAWDSISEIEIKLIKGKQKEIFEERVHQFLENKKNAFERKFKNSQLKERLFTKELNTTERILFAKGVSVNGISDVNLYDIRSFIDIVKLNGAETGYDFVYSPNCKIKASEIEQSEIWAEALFQYRQWLINSKPNFIVENSNTESENKYTTDSALKYDTGIFLSANAFLIFDGYLKELEFHVKKQPLVYLSYIYWCLKEDNYLSTTVKPAVWIDFLSKDPFKFNLQKVKTKANSDSVLRAMTYTKIKSKITSLKK